MHDLPVALVDHPVMPVAEQDQVAEVGCPAMDPVNQVMRRAPPRRAVTSRPAAAAVASVERPPSGLRNDALGAPDVDHQRLGVEEDASNAGIAGQPLDGFGRNRE